MKFITIDSNKVIKYIAVVLAVLLLISSVSAISLAVKNNNKAKEISMLEEELKKEQAIYDEKSSAYDKLKEEQSSDAKKYDEELKNQKETIDNLNKKIEELNKQLSKKEESTKKDASDNKNTIDKLVMPDPIPSKGKTVYLTFDDGPSPYTSEILDILDKYGVKATFFVINGKYNKVMKEIVDRGHSIGLHAYEHKYDTIYASDEAYFMDLQKISDVVKEETGVETKIIRFPGGSSNTISKKYSSGIMTRLTKSVEEKGYVYFDWNCINGDADGANTVQKQLNYCSQFPKSANNITVLMHDNKKATMEALPKIIEYYKSCQMDFGTLNTESVAYHHPVYN